MKRIAFIVVVAWSCAAHAITIPTVLVGNAGNPADTQVMTDGTTGYGRVNYEYRIATTEVTVGQYTAFLNAVAATDTYALYRTDMATNLNVAGISRTGASGNYVYSVIGSPNKPVTYVSWGDAARFSNWLHNGQPTGAQDASTTEDGAYTLNGATSSAALSTVSRNSGAVWFITTENEWYKAAYHQPAAQGGDRDGFWQYPIASNSVPYSDQPPGSTPDNTRVGNFVASDFLANGYNDGYAVTGSLGYSASLNYLTDAGGYTFATSHYGTYDQGGNVWEWTEALLSGSFRILRGGSWDMGAFALSSSSRSLWAFPMDESSKFGFRVAAIPSVPEPSSIALAVLGFIGLIAWDWRRRF